MDDKNQEEFKIDESQASFNEDQSLHLFNSMVLKGMNRAI